MLGLGLDPVVFGDRTVHAEHHRLGRYRKEGAAYRPPQSFDADVGIAITLAGGYALCPADTVAIHCGTAEAALS